MTPSPAKVELVNLNLIQMFGLLIGGLALFLLGLEFMTGGLKAIAGSRLQALLGMLTSNRFRGVLARLMALDHLPGLAQVAIQSGRHAARTITRRLGGDTAERPFRYRDLGTMATVSRFQAIASIGRVRMSGFPAWLMWLVVHLLALTGFKNRLAVLFNHYIRSRAGSDAIWVK